MLININTNALSARDMNIKLIPPRLTDKIPIVHSDQFLFHIQILLL